MGWGGIGIGYGRGRGEGQVRFLCCIMGYQTIEIQVDMEID